MKRDQLNFVFDNLSIVLPTPAKNKMLKKEDSMTKGGIPRLLIFKTLQKMRQVPDFNSSIPLFFINIFTKILDAKLKDQEKETVEKKQGGVFFQFSLPPIDERIESIDEKAATGTTKSPLKTTQKSPSGKKEENEEEKKEELERKKYGVR